ncbi:helix-turn-helix transcriptional regulator [Kibdelosporangium philippinense]|uniref:Helix-turn-helix transcriptional regulator n=1 Tax=Kibdelosporangium philippinense TaxID=211113 RepID=A0ABS8Z9B1_9PSEU|nr:helix-turn-helix transcriptional regulator [Kibdelosporangium philippinense]MCE7004470.1 helix-turn-helix transcriptional regulator [Kibdelosporangium philippinense]
MTGVQPDHLEINLSGMVLRVSRAAIADAIGKRRTNHDPHNGEAWLATASALGDGAVANLFTRSPLAAAHFEQVLIHGLLDSQPETLLDQADSMPDAVRRAVDFCADHAGDPITTSDIALAARTSVRSLQRVFRTYLGMSPLEHLQRVRLKRAHDDLEAIAAGRAEGTVAEVASRWGFAHLGRFAGLYRRTYGHSPVQTLRAATRPSPNKRAPRADNLCTAAPLCR